MPLDQSACIVERQTASLICGQAAADMGAPRVIGLPDDLQGHMFAARSERVSGLALGVLRLVDSFGEYLAKYATYYNEVRELTFRFRRIRRAQVRSSAFGSDTEKGMGQ